MLALLLIAAMLVPQMLSAQTATQPAVGDGSADNPYQITTAEELAWFRDKVNSTVGSAACAMLADNISMGSVCHAAGDDIEELSWEPISSRSISWSGTFDGNGKTLSGLYINADKSYAGLFGYSRGTIKNLNIKNAAVTVKSQSYSAILLGYSQGSTVQNITVDETSSINAYSNVGSIVGFSNLNSNILNCENHATVSAYDNAGGICGRLFNGYPTVKGCANYGNVSATFSHAGGITGQCSNITMEDCANYAATIYASIHVGGITGILDAGKLKNVFSNSNVIGQSTGYGGLIVGFCKAGGVADGLVVYDSEAELTRAGKPSEAVAIGTGTFSSGDATAYSRDVISKGVVAYLLQQNASEGVSWGQNLADTQKAYPILWSTDRVYADGNVAYACTGTLTGSLTNTQPAVEGSFTITHTPITHHSAVAATCLTDGNMEYYECEACHSFFSDEALTTKLKNVVIPATGHDYYGQSDVCSKCGTAIPSVKLGDNTIRVDKVVGGRDDINGQNLVKYVAPASGSLEVTTISSADTYGTLWDDSKSSLLVSEDKGGDTYQFKFTYDVTKGNTYYIGVREYNGAAIGDLTLSVKLNGLDYVVVEGINGDGTAEAPFELTTAEHLKWFAQHVNGTYENSSVPHPHPTACAKLMNDISLSSVCHAAGNGTKKQSWEPISTENVKWKGTFDGNGRTISDLYFNDNNYSKPTGLFGYIGGGTIKNVTIENAQINNWRYTCTGLLVGRAEGATILNVKTYNSTVAGGKGTGGICGLLQNSSSTIKECANYSKVNGNSDYTGGICGRILNSTIKGCANYGKVNSKSDYIGGIAGAVVSGCVEDCANYAEIQGGIGIGGIVGQADTLALKNVFSYSCIAAEHFGGLIIGYCNHYANTATGLIAYNSESSQFTNGSQAEVYAIGAGELKSGFENIKAFTKAEIRSGEVAYLLNNGVTDGTQTWYQKLGEDGDAYPVMTKVKDNTVYRVTEGEKCNGESLSDSNPGYSNTTVYVARHDFHNTENSQGLYVSTCTICGTYKDDKRTIKDFAGTGNDLEVTEAEDGTYSVAELTLNDGNPYYSPVNLTVGSLSYDRSFAGSEGKWQALFVPFALDCSYISDSYEVAAINNFHEYEQKDGTTKVVLEVKTVTSGTIDALTPCVIRLKKGGDATQPVLKNGSMECELVQSRGDNANRYIDCSSVTRYYRFSGLLQPKQGFSAGQDFALNGGQLFHIDTDGTLKAQRWYLSATDRNGGSDAQLASLRSIAIEVVGEGTATGIDGIYVTTDTVDGQSSRHGIYDLQGRKLNEEPASGVYIKDGKKQVK